MDASQVVGLCFLAFYFLCGVGMVLVCTPRRTDV